MNLNPGFLNIYTKRQLDQLSEAGSNVDNGSSKTSPEVHLTPGISRNIFLSLLEQQDHYVLFISPEMVFSDINCYIIYGSHGASLKKTTGILQSTL